MNVDEDECGGYQDVFLAHNVCLYNYSCSYCTHLLKFKAII